MSDIRIAGSHAAALDPVRSYIATIAIAGIGGTTVVLLGSAAGFHLGLALLVASLLGSIMVVLRYEVAAAVIGIALGLAVEARFEIYGISFALVEVLVLCTLLFYPFMTPVGANRTPTFYEVLLLLFMVFRISLIPWASDQRHAFSDARDWLWPILLLIALSRAFANRRAWTFARNSFVLGATLSALYGIGQALWALPAPFINASGLGKTFIDFDLMDLMKVTPAVGFQEHPNTFAIYLVIAMALVTSGLSRRQGWRRQIAALFVLGILAMGVYYSYTKTAYAGLLLAVVGSLVSRRWKVSLPKTVLLLACILAVIVVGIHQMEHRGDDIILATVHARQMAWDASLATLTDSRVLFFGGGLGNVLMLTGMHPHNILLYLLVGYGLVGAGLLGGAFLLFASRLVARARHCGAHAWGGLPRTATLLILYIAVTGMFESIVLGIHQRMLLAFVGSLLVTWPVEGEVPAARVGEVGTTSR